MRLPALAAVSMFLVLAGCEKSDKEPATPVETTDSATSDVAAKPGMVVSEGKLLLPVVAGRPGGVYFNLINNSDKPVTLAAVSIANAAKAEIHKTEGGTMTSVSNLEIKPGETVNFARGGLHVMAFELSPALASGSTTEMTLIFADGDKLSVPLEVEAMVPVATTPAPKSSATPGPNNEMEMPGMGHGDPH